MNRLKYLAVFGGIIALPILAQNYFFQGSVELDCQHIAKIERIYLDKHILHTQKTANLESRAVEQFIKSLDPAKIYLLKSDIEQLQTNMKGIRQRVEKNDCSPITDAHSLFLKRVSERVQFVKKTLGDQFKFNKNTKFLWDRDQREYPANLAEAENFHRNYLQFQVANYLAADSDIKDAKEKVVRNYERLTKRLRERKLREIWSMYLDSFAHALDPHSSYLSQENLEDFRIQMELSLEGIGATLSSQDGFTVIEALIPGGTAARSGKLKPKDKIIAVGQGTEGAFENVIEMDLRDVVALIRGKKNTDLRLRILRKEGKKNETLVVGLKRDEIKLEDEAANLELVERSAGDRKIKVGLLDLPSFYLDHREGGRSSADDMKRLLAQAKKAKVQSLVLDLSTNGGGSLDDAVRIAGLFFKKGNVVKQSHRDARKGETALADKDAAVDWNLPLVVLISRISASASEIVAGTLQDYKRAVIVGGDHTFGKGSVQSVEPLPIRGLGALKTTVGMFFIPGGKSTQHVGVSADIELPSLYSTDELGEKSLDYSLPPKTITSFLSPEAFVNEGKEAWRQITPAVISQLRKYSQSRVASSKAFKDLQNDIAKNKAKGKTIVVSEILDGKNSQDKSKDGSGEEVVPSYAMSREEKKKKYLERADVQEAINIAADLVFAQEGQKITISSTDDKLNKFKKAN